MGQMGQRRQGKLVPIFIFAAFKNFWNRLSFSAAIDYIEKLIGAGRIGARRGRHQCIVWYQCIVHCVSVPLCISALCGIGERIVHCASVHQCIVWYRKNWKPSGRNNCMHLKAWIEAFDIGGRIGPGCKPSGPKSCRRCATTALENLDLSNSQMIICVCYWWKNCANFRCKDNDQI